MNAQLFARELKCSFNLRMPHSDKPTLIYMVTRIHGRQYKFSTGMKVYPSHWQPDVYRAVTSGEAVSHLDISNNRLANNRIEKFALRFEQFKVQALRASAIDDDLPGRLRKFMSFESPGEELSRILHDTFAFLYPPDLTTKGTLRTNRSRLRKIDEFLHLYSRDVIDQKLMDAFFNYLAATGTGVKRTNECCGLLKRLINTASQAFANGGIEVVPVSFAALKDKRRREDSKRGCLTPEELQALETVKLPAKEDSYRKLFMFQTECGVRVSDLPTVINGLAEYDPDCFTFPTVKEGIYATIFISRRMRSIINHFHKENAVTPRFGIGFNSLYNRAIKEIARKAGLDRKITWKEQRGRRLVTFCAPLCEVISSHFARHTFITTRVREGWNADTLRLLTGHADDTMIRRVYTHLSVSDRRDLVMAEYRRLQAVPSRITESTTGGLHTCCNNGVP